MTDYVSKKKLITTGKHICSGLFKLKQPLLPLQSPIPPEWVDALSDSCAQTFLQPVRVKRDNIA